MLWAYRVAEISMIVLFTAGLIWMILTRARFDDGSPKAVVLVSAFLYGILLETLNIYLSHRFYFYSRNFLFMVGEVPVFIGMGWAVIATSAREISDRLFGGDVLMGAVGDSVLAINIDLVMDAVAIRIPPDGFWTWAKLSLNEGWFGVPAGNLTGWMLVVFYFSLLMRILWKKKLGSSSKNVVGIFVVPLASYFLFAVSNVPVILGERLIFGPSAHTLHLLFFLLLYFAFLWLFVGKILKRSMGNDVPQQKSYLKPMGKEERLWVLSVRGFFHAFFLIVFFLLGMEKKFPSLLFVSLILLLFDWSLLSLMKPDSQGLPRKI